MKHAPGTWVCRPTGTPDYARQYAVYVEETGRTVALVYDGEFAEGNGHLIAAAPKLRDALDGLRQWAKVANAAQHAGLEVTDEVWSMIYQYTNEAGAALAESRGET